LRFNIFLASLAVLAGPCLYGQDAAAKKSASKKTVSTSKSGAKTAAASKTGVSPKAPVKTTPVKTTPVKTTPVKTTPVKTAAVSKPGSAPKAGTTTARRKSTARKPGTPVTVQARQTQPSSDRYKEIQEALASRGYLSKEPDGSWGAESVDALKRFQRDQNIIDDGKIGSLSLIALGLGPRRIAAASPNADKAAAPLP
jgi:Putative peptidoglycan binding domain